MVITDDTHIGPFIDDHPAGPHGDDGRVEDLEEVLVTAVTTGQTGDRVAVVPGSAQTTNLVHRIIYKNSQSDLVLKTSLLRVT